MGAFTLGVANIPQTLYEPTSLRGGEGTAGDWERSGGDVVVLTDRDN